jgi:SET domain-containing protein
MKKAQKYYNNLLFNLEIRASQIHDSGNGLFTREYIKKGSFLGYYDGYWSIYKNLQSNYCFYINDKIYIDIDLTNKPYSSIMNDAFRTDFKNNIELVYTHSEKEREKINKKNCSLYDPSRMVRFYSVRDIEPGEELFFSYGESYWKSW